jgi:3-phenylpropionate/trans-cinnamate dioxygenase ferredoxin reductase subunit
VHPDENMAERVVIIGAGQAGVQAVASLRAEGFTGVITLAGEEGFPPYQRPPLSKAYLAGDLARERLFLKPASFFSETGCDLRVGVTATRIDRTAKRVRLSDGSDLAFDTLLLTTGARVRRLPVPGAALPGVHYLRGIDDVDALRPLLAPGARLAVVGGGYIGLEVAAVAVKHGLEVTIVEAASRVMERAVSPVLSEFYAGEHRAHGVTLMLGAAAQGFEGEAHVEAVLTNKGRVPADLVLIGIGVVPNSEIAAAAGLVCGNGIVVDEFTRTSDPAIYAAGDCTDHPAFAGGRSRLESVQNAIDQAKHVALAIVGRPKAYREVPWFWSDQYDLKLQMAGLARAGDETVVRGTPESRKFAVFHLREGAVAAVEAVNAAPEYVVGRKLIAEGKKIAPETLRDVGLPMKSFL